MSPPRKNGDIRNLFKSAGPSTSQTHDQPTSSPQRSSRYSLPELTSSPRTPPRSTIRRPFDRTDEIKGSDESDLDNDSDSSFASITKLFGNKARPAAYQRRRSVQSTPQAKRIASGIHQSPLTIQPKMHKFDLKALVKHSREIEKAEESVRQADAMIALEMKSSDQSETSETEDPCMKEAVRQQLFTSRDGDDDGKNDKIRQAMKRSEDDGTPPRKYCYFFPREGPLSKPGANVFPCKQAVGRWKWLAQADTRRQTFIMGLPYAFVDQGTPLPDELFQWVLDEICTERNPDLQRQYLNLVELCKDNTRRLVNDMRMYALLERIGGPRYSREHSKFKTTTQVRQEYLEQNWSPLATFLHLLERIAPNLHTSSAISGVQLLLRMSLDPVLAVAVREHHVRAMTALVSRLARSRSQWNTACEAICSYVYENIDDLEVKVTAVLSMSSSSLPLVDLRRRLAAETLFGEAGLGSQPIDPQVDLKKISNRLDEDDVKPVHKPGFDYEHLRGLVILLDIVIDGANFMRPTNTTQSILGPSNVTSGDKSSKTPIQASKASSSSISTTIAATCKGNETNEKDDEEQRFNADVDILTARVKALNGKIRDKSLTKNVKLSLMGLEKRLQNAVRTQPPPRTDIFSSHMDTRSNKLDANVPKQREFMRQWALKKKANKDVQREQDNRGGEFADGGGAGGGKQHAVSVG